MSAGAGGPLPIAYGDEIVRKNHRIVARVVASIGDPHTRAEVAYKFAARFGKAYIGFDRVAFLRLCNVLVETNHGNQNRLSAIPGA
jgi:hypothetical protein